MQTSFLFGLVLAAPLLPLLAAGCGDDGVPPRECGAAQWLSRSTSAPEPGAPPTNLFQCEHRTPDILPSGQVACVVLEARSDETCTCDAADGRVPVTPEHAGAVDMAEASAEGEGLGWSCFCEVPALEGDARMACQNDPSDPLLKDGAPVHGWCYLDATLTPPLGDPEMVASCPSTERRAIRMVGKGAPSPGASAVIICQQEICND